MQPLFIVDLLEEPLDQGAGLGQIPVFLAIHLLVL